MATPFLKKSFQDAGCLAFFQKIEELGVSDKRTSVFAHRLRRDKVTISWVVFTLSTEAISIATRIPNHGELLFKRRDLDIENYKMFLKPPYKATPKHIFPFRHSLDNYSP